MNTEQIEKAIQLCRDLQTHALNEIVKGVKAGERLSTKDLRLIEDIRKQLEAQRTFANGAEEWLTLADAGKRLGVNVRTLQLWCSGKDALRQPPLPHKREGRTILLPIQAAHAHLTQHAKRLALKPLDLSTESESEDPEEAEPGTLIARLESSLSRMHRRLVETPHGLRLYSQTLKILEETKLRREAMERNLTTDDAIKMLRSLGNVYCETIQSHAAACAADLLSVIRDQIKVDLNIENAGAHQIITTRFCEQANRITIPAIRREVERQVNAVQVMECTA